MVGKFNIVYTPSFDRELKRIFKKDKKILSLLEKVVENLCNSPLTQGKASNIKKLVGVKQGEGQWRIRAGVYRFRFDIFGNTVVLHCVRDRKDSY